MPPVRPLSPTSLSHLEVMLTDDGSRTLFDRHLNETYHSGCGALSECWYVYLLNSGVMHKLATQRSQPVRVLELGFGTGLGWLLTAACANVHGAELEYVSLEKQLLPVDVLRQIDASGAVAKAMADGWVPREYGLISEIEEHWLQARADAEPADQLLHHVSPGNQLQLFLGDARDFFTSVSQRLASDLRPAPSLSQAVSPRGLPAFDAIYFDAFSPSTSPELWQMDLFNEIAKWLQPNGTLVSYCVSGAVRRLLESCGYLVERLPGPPGGKRQVLCCRPVSPTR